MTILETRPPTWPYARAHIDNQLRPVLIAEWVRVMNDAGYHAWQARCLWWDGEAKVALVPVARVERVG